MVSNRDSLLRKKALSRMEGLSESVSFIRRVMFVDARQTPLLSWGYYTRPHMH